MIIQAKEPIVEVHDLTVSYHNKPVLWDIDFSLPAGVLAGIIGPNGAGKSTLIKTIMGLIKPSSGYTNMFGQDLEKVRKRVSYVPQRETVDWDFPASVFDVVLMGRYAKAGLFKSMSRSDKEVAMESIRKVGLEAMSNRQISQLSGGQQQRVFIARALAQDADLYFMDEPFAGVDMATEADIIKILKEMKDKGKTVVVVHHDLQSAIDYFDWMVMLNMRLVASGPTSQVFNQATLQETYGSRLNVLTKIGEEVEKRNFPIRKNS
ncbi:MAG TPA: manganese ABC transporter ATP-binding protein [Cytophagales bacterium]|nr:manganese ABC transporter ATP-binding protein [Cytophagales bacterium]